MNLERPKPRINASMLPKYHGEGVVLLGMAQAMDANGTAFQVKAADQHIVNITMQEPVQEYVEGLVEVHGVVQPNNSIMCHNYILFAPENANNFDLDLYNKSLTLINQHPDHYIMGMAP